MLFLMILKNLKKLFLLINKTKNIEIRILLDIKFIRRCYYLFYFRCCRKTHKLKNIKKHKTSENKI